jgi:hypothetical protein
MPKTITVPWLALAFANETPVDRILPIVVPWFSALFAMVVLWFVLVSWVFSRLRKRHPSTYEAMGSPTLFWNNSPRGNWLFLKFLYSSRWRELGDSTVSNIVRFMRVYFVIYLVLFLALVAFVFIAGR